MRRSIVFLLIIGISLYGATILFPSYSSNAKEYVVKNLELLFGQPPSPQGSSPATVVNRIAILSDSHEDQTYFPQVVDQIIAQPDLTFVAHLGDLSNAGDKAKLQEAKSILDRISVPVYVLPGDHDLNWFPQHNLANFKQVFGLKKTYFSLTKNNQHFIFIDNSDLNQGLDSGQLAWLEQDLDENRHWPTYVFMSTPTSNPYLSFKAMGSQNQTVATQAKQLAQLLAEAKVKVIFAGDTHIFSQYPDTTTKLPIVTAGSAGSTKNLLPLYLIVEFFSDGSYNVASIPFQHAIPLQGSD